MTTYYVDSNASGANNGTSWTDAYANISTALAGSVTTNDIIWCAHNHSHNYNTTTTLTFPSGVEVYSVNSGTDAYQAGALEQSTSATNSANGFQIDTQDSDDIAFFGLTLAGGNDLNFIAADANYFFNECTLILRRAALALPFLEVETTNPANLHFNNCSFQLGNAGQTIQNAGRKYFNNCDLFVTGTVPNHILANDDRNSFVSFKYCDLRFNTAVTEASGTGDPGSHIEIEYCKLSSDTLIASGSSAETSQVRASHYGTADQVFKFAEQNSAGIVSEDTATYLNATYDGTTGFSVTLNCNATASTANPLRGKVVEIPAQDLSAGATVTVEFTAASSLTDTTFWIEAIHNDVTDNCMGAVVSTRASDILAAGTAHTTSTESWTAAKTFKQKDTVTIPTVTSLTNGTIIIYACSTGTDVWVDPAVVIT